MESGTPPATAMATTGAPFWVAAACTAVTIAVTAHTVTLHLYNYRRPNLQRLIIRILIMPVVYALCSWLSFGIEHASAVLDPIRDFYEAFVLWVFFQLMVAYIGGERELLLRLDDGRLPTYHLFPLHWFVRPVDFSVPRNFLLLKRGILQFVVIKAVLSVLTIVLRMAGCYEEGVISADTGYIYVSLCYNLSITVSMYCLVLFYITARFDLVQHDPMPKFLCIKAVVFFSFWQSFALSILVKAGLIRDSDDGSSANSTAEGIQNFLICLEMVAASVAHRYAFSHREYADMQSARLPLGSAIRDAIGFNDLLLEMRHTWRGTDFRRYNDLMDGRLTSGYHRTPVTPLSAATAFGGLHTPHLVRAHTSLHFEDVEDDDETERLFEQAKLLEDGDYGYRVIAPSPQR